MQSYLYYIHAFLKNIHYAYSLIDYNWTNWLFSCHTLDCGLPRHKLTINGADELAQDLLADDYVDLNVENTFSIAFV